MDFPLYLAMTAQEMAHSTILPQHMGFLGCCLSSSSPGVSGLPRELPERCMLILDDRNPFQNHNPRQITAELEVFIREKECESLLLDFQRPGNPDASNLVKLLSDALPCPVAVSHCYGSSCSGPVFLPPVPADRSLREHIAPWAGREIWLETSFAPICLTLTESGCTVDTDWLPDSEPGFPCEKLHSHYHTEITPQAVHFHFRRTRDDLDALLRQAKNQGITRAVGLWQELG